MKELSQIKKLRDGGFRITNARRELLDLFAKSRLPLSAKEALASLPKRVDKTTIYREIEFFDEHGILLKTDFGDGTSRYELTEKGHHHHLICLGCKKIEDVILDKELEGEEQKILSKKGFAVSRHNLEFFGLCKSCK